MRMTPLHCLAAGLLSIVVLATDARAQSLPQTRSGDVLYRCESATGISIQGTPCPKGVTQRRIEIPKTAETTVAPKAPVATSALAPKMASPTANASPVAAPRSKVRYVPVTPDDAIHGPNEPYPLWQCMRADGSTYDSRDGVAGKQWVPTPDPGANATDAGGAPLPANISSQPKGPITREIPQTVTVEGNEPAAPDLGPPPPGAAVGKWVADQCERLPPEKACARYAARRDLLRRQIYAAKPSDRDLYAPEEQDLTVMLYTACGR